MGKHTEWAGPIFDGHVCSLGGIIHIWRWENVRSTAATARGSSLSACVPLTTSGIADMATRPSGSAARRAGAPLKGCERAARHVGYCPMHARRADRNGGDPGGAEPKRRWTAAIGDRHTLATGYVRVKIGHEHPRAYASGWILEHILVMEEKLGRRLLPGENVHHINGRRDDNRPENLELWVTMQPAGQRPSDMLAWAQEVIRRYGDET